MSDDGPVLVTGAAGFIGAYIIRELLRRRIPAVALVRQRGRAWQISGLDDLVVVEAEMTKPSTIVRAIETTQPSTIINAASYRGKSWRARQGCYGGRQCDRCSRVDESCACEQHLPAHTIGNQFEYGDHPNPLTEDTPLHPKNAYGASKAAASLSHRPPKLRKSWIRGTLIA